MQTVLVVEDEPIIRLISLIELEDAGFITIEAKDADEAIAILEKRQDIDFIFTDVNMPGSMDGAKLAAAVRDRWPPVHIIVTSGRVKPARMPAEAIFIPKPYKLRNVIAAMKAFEIKFNHETRPVAAYLSDEHVRPAI